MHNTNTLRGLFITHDISNYGASRSLQLLLNNCRDIHIDLMVRNNLFRRDVSIEDIRSRFGAHIASITRQYLPFDQCFKYRQDASWRQAILSFLNRIVWKATKNRVYDLIEKGKYDFIHLNSLVLHPLITTDHPFVIHMRDIYDHSSRDAVNNIRNARGVIFIDEATMDPFRNVPLVHTIVLNNPFDMTQLSEYAVRPFVWPEQDFTKRAIFSIIGGVTEKKGVDFIIRCFMDLRNDNARLLIVGRGEGDYESRCRELSSHDKRIIFWGEEQDILKIYAVSDYILRGEEYQCIGRTIYEGLYAGCKVILPAEADKRHRMFEYDQFKDSIFHYGPRNASDLLNILEQLSRSKVIGRTYRSNATEHASKFNEFIRQVVCRAA